MGLFDKLFIQLNLVVAISSLESKIFGTSQATLAHKWEITHETFKLEFLHFI